ncbi:hypothetical protein O3P69_014865 [Scylla paramamosain]|uniref:Pro-resilin n=1 Tax=Scylla paramamosain TaxID=85552 RepID=A0AAW0TZJ0_SCYPA
MAAIATYPHHQNVESRAAWLSPSTTTPPLPLLPRHYISYAASRCHHHSHSCTNMACKLLLVLATLVAFSAASYVPQDSYGAAPANYDFNWAVNDAPSGNNYGHQEARNGDNTQGYYFVQLPDGRLQKVTYSVQGDSGFLAELLLVLAALVALSAASYVPQDSYGAAPANYNFNWAVDDAASNNNYGHQETRNGDNTQGYYFVQLPDGRLQKVTYSVQGDSGFLAEVTYEGEAHNRHHLDSSPSQHCLVLHDTQWRISRRCHVFLQVFSPTCV